jgi:hypothetical protein
MNIRMKYDTLAMRSDREAIFPLSDVISHHFTSNSPLRFCGFADFIQVNWVDARISRVVDRKYRPKDIAWRAAGCIDSLNQSIPAVRSTSGRIGHLKQRRNFGTNGFIGEDEHFLARIADATTKSVAALWT